MVTKPKGTAPRVVLEWRSGPPEGFLCTACQRLLVGGPTVAYDHRKRHHKGCRTVLMGQPGAKRARFASPADREAFSHKSRARGLKKRVQACRLTALNGPFMGPPESAVGAHHRAVNFPHVSGPPSRRVAEVSTLVASRVPGCGRRIVTGAGDWRTRQAAELAVSLVAAHVEALARRLGAAEGGAVALEGAEWDVQLSVGHTGSMHGGPSSGLGMAMALAALVLRRQLQPGVLATGEIDLRGQVHAIGDVVLKIDAARRRGMSVVLVPHENFVEMDLRADLEGQDELRAYILTHVHPVKDLVDALGHALQGGAEQAVAAGDEEAACCPRVTWASCPGLVYQRRVLPLTVEVGLVPGGRGQIWVTGDFLSRKERVDVALTCVAGLLAGGGERPWAAAAARQLRQMLSEDGLHVNLLPALPTGGRPWDVLGVTLGLALLSLSLQQPEGCPRPAEGVAVLGDLRADGAITGTLHNLAQTVLPLASRQGWRRVFVPASEAARLQGSCAGRGMEVMGAEWLTDCLAELFGPTSA